MKFEIVVIGTSLGGLQALEVILSSLPKSFPLPIAIAQHRHKSSDGELVHFLQQHSLLPIVEVEDKQALVGGNVYLAPADYHLLVEPGHFSLSTEAPISYARPSIDVLFETGADVYREGVIGVILTGANQDGAQGLLQVNAYSGVAIVQTPNTSVCRTMPDAAISAVPTAKIIPVSEIGSFLVNLCSSS